MKSFVSEKYPLHLLAGSGSPVALDKIKTLLDSGKSFVDERDPDDNFTPLHVAAFLDNLSACQLLLHYGANIESRDIDGRKPLDIAIGLSKHYLQYYSQEKTKRKDLVRFVLLGFRNIFRRKHLSRKIARIKSHDLTLPLDRLEISSDYENVCQSRDEFEQKNLPISIDFINSDQHESLTITVEHKDSHSSSNSENARDYSHALQSVILNSECDDQIELIGLVQERLISDHYATSLKENDVSFFCYLLIDPTKLPGDRPALFRDFVKSIFYVGKGKRSRPIQHLIDAQRCRVSSSVTVSDKLSRILNLWSRGLGVISLGIFTNIHSSEAFIREGSMIDAIGIQNLTNLQRGSFPGIAQNWSNNQIMEFGALILLRAFIIFQNERCRPILEFDLTPYIQDI